MAFSVAAAHSTDAPLGQPPAYRDRPLSAVPNEAAILRRIWAPGLDDGFTPQGVVFASGRIHMAAYADDGGCRVFSLSPETGAVERITNIPACRHGGGIAALPDGRLVLIDTRALFVIRDGAVERRIALEAPLAGSFGEAEGEHLWIGAYSASNPGRLWRLPLASLAKSTLGEADATRTLTIPTRAQGLAFVKGEMWLAFSGSSFGRIARIDANTGEEIVSHATPAGIEDFSEGPDGLIWIVSEAGARKYRDWTTNFPLIFAIDAARLR